MAGPPAFQFYPADFVMGTLVLSNACVGAYIRLLCYQWEAGAVPNNDQKIAHILHESRDVARALWQHLAAKFELGPDGQYRNPRLELVRQKTLAFLELQTQRGRKGGLAKQANRLAGASSRLQPKPSPRGDQPNASSSIFDLRSSVRTEKERARRADSPVETVEKSPARPKVSTLAAMIREDVLPLAIADEGDVLEAAKARAAGLGLPYTSSALRKALASALAQRARAFRSEGSHVITERLLARPSAPANGSAAVPVEARERLQRLKADLGTPAAPLHPRPRSRRRSRHA